MQLFSTPNTTEHSIDDYALAQLQTLCDHSAFTGSKIRVMPDVHPGKVTTIGFTATLGSRLLPNAIGIDIGCGMILAKVKGKKEHHKAVGFDLTRLCCYTHIQEKK